MPKVQLRIQPDVPWSADSQTEMFSFVIQVNSVQFR